MSSFSLNCSDRLVNKRLCRAQRDFCSLNSRMVEALQKCLSAGNDETHKEQNIKYIFHGRPPFMFNLNSHKYKTLGEDIRTSWRLRLAPSGNPFS